MSHSHGKQMHFIGIDIIHVFQSNSRINALKWKTWKLDNFRFLDLFVRMGRFRMQFIICILMHSNNQNIISSFQLLCKEKLLNNTFAVYSNPTVLAVYFVKNYRSLHDLSKIVFKMLLIWINISLHVSEHFHYFFPLCSFFIRGFVCSIVYSHCL